MERYTVSVDKFSGIKDDPNEWSSDSRYIIYWVKRIVRVSVETSSYREGPDCLDRGGLTHRAAHVLASVGAFAGYKSLLM